jgi:hypothetical protein
MYRPRHNQPKFKTHQSLQEGLLCNHQGSSTSTWIRSEFQILADQTLLIARPVVRFGAGNQAKNQSAEREGSCHPSLSAVCSSPVGWKSGPCTSRPARASVSGARPSLASRGGPPRHRSLAGKPAKHQGREGEVYSLCSCTQNEICFLFFNVLCGFPRLQTRAGRKLASPRVDCV